MSDSTAVDCRTIWLGDAEQILPFTLLRSDPAVSCRVGTGIEIGKGERPSHYFVFPPSPALAAPPPAVLSIPSGAVCLSVAADADEVGLSLWIFEFSRGTQISKNSWKIANDPRSFNWSPSPECEAIRLALRASGTGCIREVTLTVSLAESAHLLDREIPLHTGSLLADVDWLGTVGTVKLHARRNSEVVNAVDGSLVVGNESGGSVVLTDYPEIPLSEPPSSSLPVPIGPAVIKTKIDAPGLQVSLVIHEFANAVQQHVASWRIERGEVTSIWTPHSTTSSFRLGLRVKGRGEVRRLHIAADALAKVSVESILSSINRQRADLPQKLDPDADLLRATLSPRHHKGVAPESIVLKLGADIPEDARVRLEQHGIHPENLDIDLRADGDCLPKTLETALTELYYHARCPHSGTMLQSNDTFLVSHPEGRPYVVVRFEGHEIFYQFYCPYKSSRIGIYFPNRGLLISQGNITSVVQRFRSLTACFADEMIRYLRDRKRHLVIPINAMSHWGHVFFNELPALREADRRGMLSGVERWLDLGNGFAGAEVSTGSSADRQVDTRVGTESAFLDLLMSRAFVVRPGIANYRPDPDVSMDLRNYSAQEAARYGFDEEVRESLDGRWPVIWMEVRGRAKRWLNQEEGMRDFMSVLQAKYPRIAFVVSGWTAMHSWTEGDADQIALELVTLRELQRQLPDISIISVIGQPAWRKTIWAINCTAFAMPEGSGASFPAEIAKLPGVLFARRDYYHTRGQGKQEEEGRMWQRIEPYLHLIDVDPNIQAQTANFRDFKADGKELARMFDERILMKLAESSNVANTDYRQAR